MKIFITSQIPQTGIELLKEHQIEIFSHHRQPTQDELLQGMKDADGVISMLSNSIDKDIIEQCPKLKVIANYAVGTDNIDICAANAAKIAIGNTPDTLTETSAELALALLMSVARKIPQSHKDVLEGKWQRWLPMGYLGQDLHNKTLGIVGMGAIGQALARKCYHGFAMKIIYHSRSNKPEVEKSLNAKQVSFDQLLQESDFVSVHTDLNPKTTNLFNKAAFSKMKSNAIFINTARGPVHNEGDLYNALKSGTIWGAGLDVTNPEPMQMDNPLLKLENVVVSPHIGSATIETRDQMAIVTAKNILAGLERKKLPGFVNSELYG